MNRTQIGTLITVASFVAGVAVARQTDTSGSNTSTESKSTMKTKSASGTSKMKTHTASGTVKDFDAGKKITVTTANNKDRSWSLDDKDVTYDVDASVAAGSKVKVVEKTDADGKKSVSIKPAAAKMHHMKSTKKTTSTSSTEPSTK